MLSKINLRYFYRSRCRDQRCFNIWLNWHLCLLRSYSLCGEGRWLLSLHDLLWSNWLRLRRRGNDYVFSIYLGLIKAYHWINSLLCLIDLIWDNWWFNLSIHSLCVYHLCVNRFMSWWLDIRLDLVQDLLLWSRQYIVCGWLYLIHYEIQSEFKGVSEIVFFLIFKIKL